MSSRDFMALCRALAETGRRRAPVPRETGASSEEGAPAPLAAPWWVSGEASAAAWSWAAGSADGLALLVFFFEPLLGPEDFGAGDDESCGPEVSSGEDSVSASVEAEEDGFVADR